MQPELRVIERAQRRGHNEMRGADVAFVSLLVARAYITAAVKEPRHRVLFWSALVVALGAGILVLQRGNPLLAGAAFLLAVPGWLLVCYLLLLLEGAVARRADRVYLLRTQGGRACGKTTAQPDQAWTLESVASWPWGEGHGKQLVDRVCADADRLHVPAIRLTADTNQVAAWYLKHFGFVEVGRSRFGQPKMERTRPVEAQPKTASATNAPSTNPGV